MPFEGIQVWGDSVLKGVIFDEERKRYCLWKESAVALVSHCLQTPIENLSQFGHTAPQLWERMKQRAKETFSGKLVIIECGGNDCDYHWQEVAQHPEQEHLPATPLALFQKTLERMVQYVREGGGVAALTTLPPLDAQAYFRWITREGVNADKILQFIGEPNRIYRWQEYYNAAILRTAAKLNCLCLPLREAFLRGVRAEKTLCADGIHPNALGHRILATCLLSMAAEAGVC